MASFRERRIEITQLVKSFRKGDVESQKKLQSLLQDEQYRKIFSKIYQATPEAKALQVLRSSAEKTQYKSSGARPIQGGAPGLGKR